VTKHFYVIAEKHINATIGLIVHMVQQG